MKGDSSSGGSVGVDCCSLEFDTYRLSHRQLSLLSFEYKFLPVVKSRDRW